MSHLKKQKRRIKMLIKLFARGVGKGKGPVEYCTLETVPKFDAKTRIRIPGVFETRIPPPVVLRGDPKRTIMLIDSSENRWKYTSGVIPFELSDKPTDKEINEVMDSFEAMAFAGLDKDQYDILWIKHTHTETGNTELHFVVPRLELTTGKALNIAPPGYAPLFDAWRDSWNYARGWASPDEPARAVLGKQDDHVLKHDAALIKAGLAKTDDPKRLLTEFLLQRIEAGTVTNRADVLASLEDAGLEINRQSKDFISVRPEPGAKPIRLKGVLYGEGFEISFDRAAALRAELGHGQPSELGGQDQSKDTIGSWRNPDSDAERASAASSKLARLVAGRASYNAGRYRHAGLGDLADALRDSAARYSIDDRARKSDQSGIEPRRGADHSAERSDQQESGQHARHDQNRAWKNDSGDQDAASGLDYRGAKPDQTPSLATESAVDRDSPGSARRLPDSLRRDLGMDDIQNQPSGAARGAGSAESGRHAEENQAIDHAVLRNAGGPESVPEAAVKQRWYDASQQKIKAIYDRARTAVINRISAAFDAVRAGHASLVRHEQFFAAAGANIVVASRSVAAASAAISGGTKELEQQVERACGVLKMNRDDELGRFKSEINLVEYAESVGYEINRKESSKSSTVMRRGDDKIIVATDADGHGIYFSVKDDSDNGSIIDFVQKREGKNLGQVRQALRPWTNTFSSYRPVVARKAEAERPRKPEPSTADRRQVLATWMKMQPANGQHSYLEQRGISRATLADSRFAGHVRIDGKANAVFPHYDKDGLAGYELKNVGFTGFAKNGTKAVWHSANINSATQIVLVESAIDAMSHAQIQRTDAAYISVGGSMSDHQRELVQGALKKAADRGAKIVIATDADDAGHKLAEQLTSLAPPGAKIERHQPTQGKDWNDQLVALHLAQAALQHNEAQKAKENSRSLGRGYGI
jgi:5S rRNA maturation endonuclease (ribonuclease M5)